jgi:hypothetical protein
MMSENIARNMHSSQGIINYPTQLHVVGHFRVLYHDARKHEYRMNKQIVPSTATATSDGQDTIYGHVIIVSLSVRPSVRPFAKQVGFH